MRWMALVIGIFLSVGLAQAQAQAPENGSWEVFRHYDVSFLLPAGWQQRDLDTFFSPDEGMVLQFDRTCPAENSLDAWAESSAAAINADVVQETVNLPLGDALRLQWTSPENAWNVQILALAEESCLQVTASSAETNPTLDRILNTVSWLDEEAPGSWLLQADSQLVVTLRTPRSWQKLPVTNSLMVRETFDEVLVQVQFRNLGGTTTPEALQPQFETLYTDRGYVVADAQSVNLPVGDALVFRLESVTLGENTLTQFQAIIMSGEYLLVVTMGADERYFAEYEQTLLQILDTLAFAPQRLAR